jgi:hypothetical protein
MLLNIKTALRQIYFLKKYILEYNLSLLKQFGNIVARANSRHSDKNHSDAIDEFTPSHSTPQTSKERIQSPGR